MKRLFRTTLAVMLLFAMSLSMAYAAGSTAQQTTNAKPKVGVFEKNGYYYYKHPRTNVLRKNAGFVKWNDNLYYIQNGGKIMTGRTFKVGNYYYRAYKNGKIAVGVYRWGSGKNSKLYYSNPHNGVWITIKSYRYQKGVKWKGRWYYLQTDSTVAVNRPVVINDMPYYANSKGVCSKLAVNTTRSTVANVARRQLGKHTKAQVRGFWTWYFGTRFRDTDATPWCGTFVGWCYKNAGCYNRIRPIGNIAYVPCYSNYAYSRGKWVSRAKAWPGDIIVFGRNRHVGIVDRVYKGYVYTIEGNSGPDSDIGTGKPGAVTRRVYKLWDPDVKGILRP